MAIGNSFSANPQDGPNVLRRLRRWVSFLDDAIRIPGTGIRFGWDPIIGLVPWLGDAVTGLFSIMMVLHAFRLGIPGFVKMRMLINILIDGMVGAIPFLGDAFDFAWKANRRNMELIEKYAMTGKPADTGDRLFVAGAVFVFLLILFLPFLLIWLLLGVFRHWTPSGIHWHFSF